MWKTQRRIVMRRPHDVGGLEAGPIDTEEHPSEPWEKRVRVMRQLLGRQKPPLVDYNHLSYHECWTAAIANILLQKGVISVDELGQKMQEVETRWQQERTS